MTLFGVVNSVLSVVFVVDVITDSIGTPMDAYFPLSADIPTKYEPCANSLTNPYCTYDLAMTALSSQLITHTPYTIGGVTFQSPNGTLGLPYQALAHFARNVSDTKYEDEYRQYCLPVLSPQIITCKELAVNQSSAMTVPVDTVQYRFADVSLQLNNQNITEDAYLIILDSQENLGNGSYLRVNDEDCGTMTIAQLPNQQNITIVTATANQGQGYAALLYELMNDATPPDTFTDKQGDFKYVAACTIPSLQGQTQYSSWKMVNFNLEGGILRANVSDQACASSRGPDFSGFADLRYALQGAASILSGTDGYTKLINLNEELGEGTPVFSSLNRLEAALNKIYHIVQTSWSQTQYKDAMLSTEVQQNPITMWKYSHLLVIRIAWTPTTWISLGIALGIALMSVFTFARWFRATGCIPSDEETWNLLRPIDLMAYALAAYQDLGELLNMPSQRKAQLKAKPGRILRDHPVGEGTESLLGLVKSASPKTPRTVSGSTTHSVPSSGATAYEPLLSTGSPELPAKDPRRGLRFLGDHDEEDSPSRRR